MASSSSLVFKIERSEPILISPAKPTPNELKKLSNIDIQKGLQFQMPWALIYQNILGMEGRDPAKMLRDAIAKALVYYYPLAGRVREGPNNKLMVECTGEGVMFIEADAHIRLDEFDDSLKPPFPCMQDLLYDVPDSDGIFDCPLLLIQVTRLLCGGFVVAIRVNHTVSDGVGVVQFLTAVAEMARGADVPSIQPVWSRELLNARDPPIVSCKHHLYEKLHDSHGDSFLEAPALVESSFVFGPQEIADLKRHLPPHLRQCSRFEIITACFWQCRTISLNVNSNQEVRLAYAVDARNICNPSLPMGYYGNAFLLPVAQTNAGDLCESPLEYALELVRKAKSSVTDEFMKSLTDLLERRDNPYPTREQTYLVSCITYPGCKYINFGWGEPIFGGPIGVRSLPFSFIVPAKNQKGVDHIVATINLPENATEQFARELDRVIKGPSNTSIPVSSL